MLAALSIPLPHSREKRLCTINSIVISPTRKLMVLLLMSTQNLYWNNHDQYLAHPLTLYGHLFPWRSWEDWGCSFKQNQFPVLVIDECVGPLTSYLVMADMWHMGHCHLLQFTIWKSKFTSANFPEPALESREVLLVPQYQHKSWNWSVILDKSDWLILKIRMDELALKAPIVS